MSINRPRKFAISTPGEAQGGPREGPGRAQGRPREGQGPGRRPRKAQGGGQDPGRHACISRPRGPGRAQGGPGRTQGKPWEGPGRAQGEPRESPEGNRAQGPVGPIIPSVCLIIAAVIGFFSCRHDFFQRPSYTHEKTVHPTIEPGQRSGCCSRQLEVSCRA